MYNLLLQQEYKIITLSEASPLVKDAIGSPPCYPVPPPRKITIRRWKFFFSYSYFMTSATSEFK
jgi:hypothetical protein